MPPIHDQPLSNYLRSSDPRDLKGALFSTIRELLDPAAMKKKSEISPGD